MNNANGYTCRRVFEGTEPVLFVHHENDGDWQLLCGSEDHSELAPSDCLVIHTSHLIVEDPTLMPLDDLPTGHKAKRDRVGAPWVRSKIDAEA